MEGGGGKGASKKKKTEAAAAPAKVETAAERRVQKRDVRACVCMRVCAEALCSTGRYRGGEEGAGARRVCVCVCVCLCVFVCARACARVC